MIGGGALFCTTNTYFQNHLLPCHLIQGLILIILIIKHYTNKFLIKIQLRHYGTIDLPTYLHIDLNIDL